MYVRFASTFSVGLAVLFSGCNKVCDTDDLSQYSLPPGVKAWTAPYPKDAVLRFRNASTGYVRSYRVTTAENKTDGVYAGIDPCPIYMREYASHTLERSDSTGNGDTKTIQFYMTAGNFVFIQSKLSIGSTTAELSLQEIEDGTQALSPATFAGRTYPAVLSGSPLSPGAGSRVVVRLYLTKAEGLIRFEERGGTAWDRL